MAVKRDFMVIMSFRAQTPKKSKCDVMIFISFEIIRLYYVMLCFITLGKVRLVIWPLDLLVGFHHHTKTYYGVQIKYIVATRNHEHVLWPDFSEFQMLVGFKFNLNGSHFLKDI